jgi:tetratricopeptide (TPR) repeat protein
MNRRNSTPPELPSLVEGLTLAMIVRDEAALLPDFLFHARGLWDELVVVDTGSTDATVELVTAAGARVVHRPWDGDFSAARNAGLDAVRTQWVLFLDADEMATPELAAQVRRAVADQGTGAATLLMRNRLPHGHHRESRLLRLFRAGPGVRFRHPIHEDISEGVTAALKASGRSLVHLSAAVDHLGYVRERAQAKDKKTRDLALLDALLARDPGDLYSHFKRLELARFWADTALWRSAALSANAALGRPGQHALQARPWAGELVALVSEGLYPGNAAAAVAFLESFAAALWPSGAFFLRLGELHEERQDFAKARDCFQRCLGLQGSLGNLQLTTVRPLLGLARLELCAGHLDEAASLVEQALRHTPRDPEALLAGAALARARGGAVGLDQWRLERLAGHGDSAELHSALGECALLAGDAALAVSELRVAAGTPPEGPSALRLSQALLCLGDVDASRSLAVQLSAGQPAAGLGVMVCDLARGKDVELSLDLEPPAADAALRAWVDALCHLRGPARPGLVEGLRRHAPAVADAFPWLPAYVEQRA